MKKRLFLAATLMAVFAFLPQVVCVAMAVVTGPEGISGTAQAVQAGLEAANALQSKNWAAFGAVALMLLGWAFKQPWLLSVFSKVPPRYRAHVMFIVGGLGLAGVYKNSGMDWVSALVSGFQSSSGATGLYEMWQGLTKKPLKDQLKEAMALTDPKARDEAVTKLANE